MADNKKRGLGRGLDLLFTDNSTAQGNVTELRLTDIEPNKDQPRRNFDEAALAELAESIRRHGLLQPITVRPMANFGYQIIAGERRWRACAMAGLETVPVIIRETADAECMEIAMIENLQREDLDPVEEARGYKALMERFGMTQEDVANAVGKSRPVVANALRLLALDDNTLKMLETGDITAGHARALLSIADLNLREQAALMAKNGATVREIEKLGKKRATPNVKRESPIATYYKEIEIALSTELGRKVKITGVNGKGSLQVDFYSDEELADMVRRLGGEN